MSEQPTFSPMVWEGERAPLAKAFVAAQKATESVKKAATNPAFKSKYADLAHVVEGVIPALNEAGVGVLQSPAYDGEFVSVTTTLLHESGASVSGTLHLRPSKSDPQGVGSAITYGRRYALLAMTGAAPEDDDGNAASGPRENVATSRKNPDSLASRKPEFESVKAAIDECADMTELRQVWKDHQPTIVTWPETWQDAINDRKEARKAELEAEAAHADQDAEFRAVSGGPAPDISGRPADRQRAA